MDTPCFIGRSIAHLQLLEKLAVSDEEQSRGLLALRRAITVRRIFADGAYQAFIGGGNGSR